MFRILMFLAFFTFASSVSAWTLISDSDDQGEFHMVEQVGEGGLIFTWVCAEGENTIEVVFPTALDPGDTALLFQVDGKPELLVAGFIDPIDDQTAIFVGVDRTDKPAIATDKLMAQAKAGNELYMGDPDLHEAVERWPLIGLTSALNKMAAVCKP